MRTVSVQEALRIALQHHQAGRLHEAQTIYRQVLEQSPDNADALHLLGAIAHQEGRDQEAVALIQKAIRVNPGEAGFYTNLGQAYRALGLPEPAVAALEKGVALNPRLPEAYHSLGKALRDMGRYEDALAAYQKAIHLRPDHAGAHFDRAVLLLLRGDLVEGWREYEWRWQSPDFAGSRPAFSQPAWRGEDPSGRTILLHGEQGFGDTIQFIRYAPLLARRGARVIVDCRPELVSLLGRVEGVEQVLPRDAPLPPFDFYVPMLSLPFVFGTALETIPAQAPYLNAAPDLVEAWRSKIASRSTPHAPRLKIGLAWAGSPTHKNDRHRSIPLSAFAPLAEVKDVTFYSLQTGTRAEQGKDPPAGMSLVDLAEDLRDFSDTAAVMANLDLVISVDTSVVHLAGALARPVWTLLPVLPDWRWMWDREDSPWYPTMRLFRQGARGDWDSVLRRVAGELREVIPCNFEAKKLRSI